MDLIQHTILFDAAAALGNQDASISRNFFTQLCYLTCTEQYFGWGMKGKVLHYLSSSLWVMNNYGK
jgi:hypothetical protein